MDLPHQLNRLVPVGRLYLSQPAQGIEPHAQIVEVLAIPVRGLADADAPGPAQDPLDFGHHPFGLGQEPVVLKFVVQGDQQHHSEGVGPEIAQPIGPDASARIQASLSRTAGIFWFTRFSSKNFW